MQNLFCSTLQRQRQLFLHQDNVVPYLARLPESFMPFGADRVASDVSWAQAPAQELFPPPLDVDNLDVEQAKALRTWFVAHVDVKPRKIPSRKSKPKRSKKRSPDDFIQLSLL
jgi:deoxyribodipyrimidine photo-lyase